MNIFLGAELFNEYVKFNELTNENSTEVNTLDGSLYVDFYNYKREWTVSWELMPKAEYDRIKTLYDSQRTNFAFTRLRVPDLDIDTFVYMKIPPRTIKWDATYIDGFSVTLIEQGAIS